MLNVKKVVDVRDLPLTTSVAVLWSHVISLSGKKF